MSQEASFTNPTQWGERPQHHVHGSSEPLPGAKGSHPAADYSLGAMDGVEENTSQQGRFTEDQDSFTSQGHTASQGGDAQGGQNAFNSERPLNVKPTPEGEGVARDGKEELPMGKANFMDKMVGKTEKVMGKMMHNPEKHEAGELRETGGKAAARGEARAPHD